MTNPTVTRCRLCAAPEVQPWHTKNAIPLYRCLGCGGAFVPETATPADLASLYAPEYFDGSASTGYPSYVADRSLIERNFGQRLRLIERLHPLGRLLDVGAAYGFLLKVAREHGWEAMGVELAEECAARAATVAGVPVVAGDFLAVDLPGRFDVVTMFDVLEHLPDPAAALRRAHQLLAPGGLLIVETGDLAAPWARLLGRRWYFLDPPQHLAYFTATGLLALMTKAGFAAPHIVRRQGRWVSLRNAAFKIVRHVLPDLAPDRLARLPFPGALYVNFGDTMIVVASASG